jgi:hypothetical protein
MRSSPGEEKEKKKKKDNDIYKEISNIMKKLIRLTEGDLHRIVRESVKRILSEDVQWGNPQQDDTTEQQYEVWNTAKQLLSQSGYEQWGNSNDNPFILKVRIMGYGDINRIKALLRQNFGVDDVYDSSVKYETNMMGGDARAVIHLPAANKINKGGY